MSEKHTHQVTSPIRLGGKEYAIGERVTIDQDFADQHPTRFAKIGAKASSKDDDKNLADAKALADQAAKDKADAQALADQAAKDKADTLVMFDDAKSERDAAEQLRSAAADDAKQSAADRKAAEAALAKAEKANKK